MPEHYFERSGSQDTPPRIEGLEFIELATDQPQETDRFLRLLGFIPRARHRSKAVTLYQQGSINLVVNATEGSFAAEYASIHGSSACALALNTQDASSTYQNLLGRGAWESGTSAGAMELNIPAIESIGGSQIYLIDRYAEGISIYDIDFKPLPDAGEDPGLLNAITGLTLTMEPARVADWRDFFRQLFGFEPVSEDCLALDKQTRIQLDGSGAADLADERIGAVEFSAADLAATQRHFASQGLSIKAAGDGDRFEVIPPSAALSFRVFISR
ncbi:hypothetical protein ACQUQP_14495 [Marinobacterium sp. YM272]|uniref:hypothetical protein n=1 Tax=Marinobacterium sp. YM272 TaxID=3421654 RepID=UPI003D7F66E1